MQKGQVVFWLLVPAHQDASKPVHPTVAALHHPTTRPLACLRLQLFGLLAPCLDMRCEAKLLQNLTHCIIIIAFVQTHPLWLFLCRFRPHSHQTFDGRSHQLHVMPVGAINRQSNWTAMAIREQAALDTKLASVSWISSRLFPPQAVPWSSLHPYSASSSQCPSVRQTAPRLRTRVSRRRLPRPILETGREW